MCYAVIELIYRVMLRLFIWLPLSHTSYSDFSFSSPICSGLIVWIGEAMISHAFNLWLTWFSLCPVNRIQSVKLFLSFAKKYEICFWWYALDYLITYESQVCVFWKLETRDRDFRRWDMRETRRASKLMLKGGAKKNLKSTGALRGSECGCQKIKWILQFKPTISESIEYLVFLSCSYELLTYGAKPLLWA